MEEATRALRRQVDRDGPAAGALAVDSDLEGFRKQIWRAECCQRLLSIGLATAD